MTDVSFTTAWADLLDVARPPHLRELFADDPDRARRYLIEVGDLRIDYSKQPRRRRRARCAAGGGRRRPASRNGATRCSPASRSTSPSTAPCCTSRCGHRLATVIEVDGHDVVPDVHEVLGRMGDFADQVRSGAWTGATGKRIRTVVNIGIGGTDLGPAMASRATRRLRPPRARRAASCPTSTAPTSPATSPISTRRRRCSSCRRRRSPRSRRSPTPAPPATG